MAPYEAKYSVKNIGSTDRKIADNLYSGLLPEIMRAHFPEYLAFSPATITADKPSDPRSLGEFSRARRTITLAPNGINAMFMSPYEGHGGYIGDTKNNATTEEVLNALNIMLHEATHARTRGLPNAKMGREHPAEQLKAQMGRDKFQEMLADIRVSGLPSVLDQTDPKEIINEYFATATPTRQMAGKNMSTDKTWGYLSKINSLSKKYPELERMRRDWDHPEIFMDTR
jgi:hypothetical protein